MLFGLLVALLLSASSYGQVETIPNATVLKNITPVELQAMRDTVEVVIYDCKEAFVFEEMHVPGARLIVYDQFTPEELPKDHNTALAFYCYSPDCPAGELAAGSAMGMGYTHVMNMEQGITGWQDAGLKTEP